MDNKQTNQGNRIKRILIICFVALLCLLIALIISFYVEGRAYEQNVQEEKVEQTQLVLQYAYQNAEWNASIIRMIEAFEQENPDIDIVHVESYEDMVYEDSLAQSIARDELGDIVQLKTPGYYVNSDILGEIPDSVSSQVSNVYEFNGHVYGVSMVESTWGIIYNKQWFEEYGIIEPATYDDFLQICEVLKANGKVPIGVGGSDLWHLEYWANHFFRTDIISENEMWLQDCRNGEVSWNDSNIGEMFQHISYLFEQGYVNENWSVTSDNQLPSAMASGEFAMIYTGPWTSLSLESVDPEFEFGWFLLPSSDGSIIAAQNRDTYWAVSKNCSQDEEKYEAATRFLEFFYKSELYEVICKDSCNFPVSIAIKKENVESDDEHNEDSNGRFRYDVMTSFEEADRKISVYIGNEDTPEQFEKTFLMIFRKVINSEISVEEGQAQIQQAWELYMEQEAE